MPESSTQHDRRDGNGGARGSLPRMVLLHGLSPSIRTRSVLHAILFTLSDCQVGLLAARSVLPARILLTLLRGRFDWIRSEGVHLMECSALFGLYPFSYVRGRGLGLDTEFYYSG